MSAGNRAVRLAAVCGDTVRALRRVVYRAAKADPDRRFHALWDKVYREDVSWRARVAPLPAAHRGSPCAATTARRTSAGPPSPMPGKYGVSRLLNELASDLRLGPLSGAHPG